MNYEELLTDVAKNYPDHVKNARVLEAFSVSNKAPFVRSFFPDCTHVGLDTVIGPGVDIKSNILGDVDISLLEKFDVLVSCRRLDEDPHWIKNLTNLSRSLRPGGLIVLEWAKSDDGPNGEDVTTLVEELGFGLVSHEEPDEDDGNWTVVARSTVPDRKAKKVKEEKGEY